MASFKNSFVSILRENRLSAALEVDDNEASCPSDDFTGDTVMIEEITIVVRAESDPVVADSADQSILATLDPLSQILWLQALRHLH